MSVFKKLKGTFHNAHQDIVDGLRIFTLTDNQPRQEELNSLSTRKINLDVGADLLYRFQTNWSTIQSETSSSAQQAEEVAESMNSMFKIWDEHAESVTHLEHEAKAISSILATISNLHSLLDDLCQDFLIAEEGLDVLENICEERELQNKCLVEQKKLAWYATEKKKEAEMFKVNLAYTYARNAAKVESVKKFNLQERAEAFMSAFHADVRYYRNHGHPDLFPNVNTRISSLSSVELDQDKEALNSFLGPSRELNNSGNLELSDEESYIEDDYTTDFSVKQDVDFLEEGDYTSTAVINEMDLDDDYIYKDNPQGVGIVYEGDDLQNTDISSVLKQLSDHEGNRYTVDSVAVSDHSPEEANKQVSSDDSGMHANALDASTDKISAVNA